MNENQIIYLEVDSIHPHPNNPRKDLGDLAELSDSIKSNGIMQNLTVVRQPWSVNDMKPIKYTVVIGHRRHAAAKLAGLKKIPCVISEMDEKSQVATMLLENMQRSDLTLWEEAQGFQMMLDFGETVHTISAKTGFSEAKVRKRVRLTELDQNKLRSAVGRGGMLADYDALNKIKDIGKRNEVLEKIGTNNFRWSLESAVRDEKLAKNKPVFIAKLKEFATKVKDSDYKIMQYVEYISFENGEVKKPEDAGVLKYYYTVSGYGITLYQEKIKTDAEVEADEKQERSDEKKKRMKELTKQAYALRFEFIKNFGAAKKFSPDIAGFATHAIVEGRFYNGRDIFRKLLNLKLEKNESLTFDTISDLSAETPERILLISAYCTLDNAENGYYNWRGEHWENKNLNTVYDFLEKLGYEISDEEQTLRSGAHELFSSGNEDECEDDYEGDEGAE